MPSVYTGSTVQFKNPSSVPAGSTYVPDTSGYNVPSIIDPATYYYVNDFVDVQNASDYNQNGNVVIANFNSVTGPLALASTQGVAYVNTSSVTQGGYVCIPFSLGYVKSTVINYQWRYLFYIPLVSTSTSRYTLYVGAMWCSGTAVPASFSPAGGGYLKYSDNLNSGNWVMGSATGGGTNVTSNSTTAPVFNGWSKLTITLNNGTYTYVVNGATVGTFTDTNITTAVSSGQNTSPGGIAIIPDGTNYALQRTAMLDRLDYYVTGLTR